MYKPIPCPNRRIGRQVALEMQLQLAYYCCNGMVLDLHDRFDMTVEEQVIAFTKRMRARGGSNQDKIRRKKKENAAAATEANGDNSTQRTDGEPSAIL